AAGRVFNGGKDGGQISVEAGVAVGAGDHAGKQLAGVDEVALGLDGVILDRRRDDAVVQLGVADAVVAAFDVAGKVLADETVEQGTQHVLLEVPAVDCATHIVGNGPD